MVYNFAVKLFEEHFHKFGQEMTMLELIDMVEKSVDNKLEEMEALRLVRSTDCSSFHE